MHQAKLTTPQLSLSEASGSDYMTPQDQPVKQRTDTILKQDVANQRVSHQSKIHGKQQTVFPFPCFDHV
jgi:hypothetical protein